MQTEVNYSNFFYHTSYPHTHIIMPHPLPLGKALSDDAVCLSRTSGLTREQRGLGKLKWYGILEFNVPLDTV